MSTPQSHRENVVEILTTLGRHEVGGADLDPNATNAAAAISELQSAVVYLAEELDRLTPP